MTMPDGPLENRYIVTHKDGEPVGPDKQYLVLDISAPDEREWEALSAFIAKCHATGYVILGDDLLEYL